VCAVPSLASLYQITGCVTLIYIPCHRLLFPSFVVLSLASDPLPIPLFPLLGSYLMNFLGQSCRSCGPWCEKTTCLIILDNASCLQLTTVLSKNRDMPNYVTIKSCWISAVQKSVIHISRKSSRSVYVIDTTRKVWVVAQHSNF
jgi:hypothetical protein